MRRLLIGVLLAGCGGHADAITSDDFAESIANIWCQRLNECDQSYFDATFDNLGDCKSTEQDSWQETHQYYLDAGCQYTDESGAALYNLFVDMTCGDLYDEAYLDDYDTIWKC